MFEKLKFLAALAAVFFAHAALATTEPLYITDGDSFTIQRIVGNTITDSNTSTPGQYLYAIAVRDTIWTAAYRGSGPQRQEFDTALSATANSGSVVWPPGEPEFIDGTTDGVYNYTIADDSGIVYRYNYDWSGSPFGIFTANCLNQFCPGITYDVRNHTFWTMDDTNIYQYAANGSLISSFAHGLPGPGGLAYESSTDTLWVVDNNSTNTLWQFSKSGVLLYTQVISGNYSGNVWGAEFRFDNRATAPIPTLSQWGLMLLSGWLALGTFFMMRRKRA